MWNRLRNEVSNYDGPLTYEASKQMKYAKAIVNECEFNSQTIASLMMVLTQYTKGLRILAPSGRSIRSCDEDCILPTGGGSDGEDPALVVRGTEVN